MNDNCNCGHNPEQHSRKSGSCAGIYSVYAGQGMLKMKDCNCQKYESINCWNCNHSREEHEESTYFKGEIVISCHEKSPFGGSCICDLCKDSLLLKKMGWVDDSNKIKKKMGENKNEH